MNRAASCPSKRSADASSRPIERGRPQISAQDFRSPMAAPRFADAVAKYDEAWMALFGVPYDRTCSFRGGSRFGPRAIREASYNFETYMMDHQRDLRDVAVADHVGVEHVVYIGVRSYSREEREDLERLGLTYVSVFDVHERGIGAALDRALKAINRDKIYLTIDIDGVDPAFAPAVGNPEPFGLAPLQVKKVIGMLAPDLVGMDLNEVSPAWDFGQTSLLAARLIREAIVAIAEARGHLG